MTLRLQGTTGFTEVKAPAAAGSNTITLPTSNGSANQVLKNGSTAGTLEFVTHRGFVTYAIICDQKTQNTDGGTFTAGAWQKRNLNTTIADPDSIVTIANDQFTLQAGTYFIEARSPAYGVDSHRIRLYNATDSSEVQLGPSSYSREASGDLGYDDAHLFARVTITSATAFEIQHRSMTSRSNNGFGVPTNFGAEIYTTVKIFKEA